jgi:hypothetical protein
MKVFDSDTEHDPGSLALAVAQRTGEPNCSPREAIAARGHRRDKPIRYESKNQ